MSLSIFLENLRLMLETVRDRTEAISELVDEFIKENKWSLLDSVLEGLTYDKNAIYKAICISAGRNGDWGLFEKYFSELLPREKLDVVVELIDEKILQGAKAVDLIKESFKGIGKVDIGDMDLTRSMAIAFSILGDYTRARFLTNTFCSLAEAKRKFMTSKIFGLADEIECFNLILYVGDKHIANERLRRLIANIESYGAQSLWMPLIDILSKHGMHDEAMRLVDKIDTDIDKSISLSIIAERAGGEYIRNIIDYLNQNISDPIAIMTMGVTLRRIGYDEWEAVFRKGLEGLEGNIDVARFVDFLEMLADNDYKDLLDKALEKRVNMADITINYSRSTLKYAYSLLVDGKLEASIRLLDEYMNDLFLKKKEREDVDFVIYYAKAILKGIKHIGDKVLEFDFHQRLQDKLYASIRELELPQEIKDLLNKITDEEYRIRAVKRILEEELYRSKCVVADQLERVFLVPRSLIDDILSSVAKRLVQEGNVTDAVACLDRIMDKNERFTVLSSVTHRCALAMRRDALVTLLKKLIVMKSRLRIVDPIEDVKIRADLAIVFKFSGREKEYKDSLREAFDLIQQLKPSEKFDYNYYRKIAEAYGYLAAALYVLGEKAAEKSLQETLKAIRILPTSMKFPILAKLTSWVTLAGWLPIVYQFLQIKGLGKLKKFVATILSENYVFQGMIDSAIEEIEALVVENKDKLDIFLSLAKILARKRDHEGAEILLDRIEDLLKGLEGLDKMMYEGELAGVYAILGEKEKALKIADKIYEEALKQQDLGIRNQLLAYVVPVKYISLRY